MMRMSGGSRCAAVLGLMGLAVGLSVFGCSSPNSAPEGAGEEAENTGSIGLTLQAGGLTLNSVSYSIIGPANYSKTGTIDVSNSTQIAAVIGGLPAGTGYSISLSAVVANDATATCAGSASFNVIAGATTAAQVHLICKVPPKNGSVMVNGTLNVCPNIDALSAEPAETTVGHAITLKALGSDTDNAPSALSYSWTASGGTLSGANTPNATVSCTVPGSVTLTLVVSDGDCSDAASQVITCSPAAGAGNAGAGGASASGGASSVAGAAGKSGVSGASGASGSGGASGLGGASGSSGSAGKGGASAIGGAAGFGGSAAGASGSAGSAGTSSGAGLIRINEVESNGGTPDDWVELYNAGTQSIDISGYVFRDNDDTHYYALPAGTVVAPGAYYVMDTVTASTPAGFNFGLGSADSTRLYLPDGTTIVDTYSWTAHASTTYGRCPNGTGAFATTASSTKGVANDCGGSSGGSGGASGSGGAGGAGGSGGSANSGGSGGSGGSTTAFATWPGGNSVVTVDVANTFTSNLSGLFYEPAQGALPAVLWGVQNGPSKLYRLLFNGTNWVSDTDNGWSAGKTEMYTTGTGGPDSEGITKAAFGTNGLYVSTERDNTSNTVSRLSVLLFDSSTMDSTLSALRDWNLTSDLPAAGANLGLEAIAWVPDAYLVSKGFIDESTNRAYDPSRYANHAGGIFFVGLEQNGMIYGYALDHGGGGYTRVATIQSGNPSIMDLSFDRDVGYLWAACDDTCQGRTNVLDIDTRPGSPTLGRFYIRKGFERPSSMGGNFNNEGFTVTPESSCVMGQKPVFYADDSNDNAHSIRRDSIPCGAFL